MNVIISNKYAAMLSNLQIDLIKSMNGEFDIDELVNTFENFFFNKMILDITAIKNYQDIEVIQKLSFNFDMNKVILVLDDSEKVNSPAFLSQLVSMGVYNFTRNIDTITYLIDNPNSYKDVAQFQHLSGNITAPTGNEKIIPNAQVGNGIRVTRILGIKNITESAGATSLVYMLKKQLENSLKVLAIEVDKNDFIFFNDPELRSVSSAEAPTILKNPNNNYDVIFVDINESLEINNISEVIYLIEPSTIKLNKMIRKDHAILEKLANKRIVLNKSLLNSVDVKDFEYEAKCKVFYNMPPLDDKKDQHAVIAELLNLLGIGISDKAPKSSKLFSIVKED